MLMNIMAEGVTILDIFVNALVDGIGEEFKDRTPVVPVCKAYAAASILKDNSINIKIQKKALNCISAYANACQDEDIPEGSEKDIWSSVCRDIFIFTTSSPVFFLPGLQLLLDLLPLPLPVSSLKELSPSDRRSLLSKRDWWCRRLTRDLPTEVCGLLEILSASPPHTSLHRHLVLFLNRIVSLGPSSTSFCQMIAASAIETVVEVYNTACSESINPISNFSDSDTHRLESGDTLELPTSSALKTLTAGTKLVLGSQQPLNVTDQLISLPTSTDDDKLTTFGSIANVPEIVHSLAYFHLVVSLPICKQALLDLTRKERFKDHRILKIFSSIMEGIYHLESSYSAAQTKLLDCIECLLDPSLGLGKADGLIFGLINHLPSVEWTSELISCLLTYLLPIGRASTISTDRVLCILNRLALHDFGFAIIQRHLCQKQHERVFANLLQGLIDNLNSGNMSTICQTTLRSFILFVSTLLADPIFAEEALLAVSSDSYAVTGLSERQLRLSTTRLRQMLHGGNKSESLVKEVVLRLEKIRGSEALRDGMKSLMSLLSGLEDPDPSSESDAPAQQPFPIPSLSNPLPFSQLYLLNISIDRQISDLTSLTTARQKLEDNLTSAVLKSPSEVASDSSLSPVNTINLVELVEHFCPGVDLQAEVTGMTIAKRRRRRDADDAEANIQHKRRKKGQVADIIQTGRSSKKYVAPMRGRGFNLRPGNQSSCSGLSVGLSTSAPGPSLLGVAVGAGGRADNFRSRPQNTSRPPSLHVDDFTKLEKDGSGEPDPSASHEALYTREGARCNRSRGGLLGNAGSQRVLSSLPFVGTASGGQGLLSNPNVVIPLQSWSGSQNVGHNLLTLTNPTPSNRSNCGNMQPPRIDEAILKKK
ncbi:unnamed protein product [Hymenolepis diminuta]|uniref:Uncharacterized protein n=1 Tax=Hymenolepis diminuta TaxID=6216 RepID=A0A564YDN9_HYMDI|nr:unnamed protein product [Hymenolepis diminuta]